MNRWWMTAALVALVACGGEEAPGEPATCDGGGAPSLALGDGGRTDFTPLGDGASIPIESYNGSYVVYIELWTSGLDTTDPMTVVVRTSVDGGPTADALGQQQLLCDEEIGNGWTGVWAPLPGDLQTEAAAQAADGAPVVITATVTDALGTTVSTELSGALAW